MAKKQPTAEADPPKAPKPVVVKIATGCPSVSEQAEINAFREAGTPYTVKRFSG
ncbi:MAG: hypothetical protein AAF170_16600 [Bacteroidota bacterium]